MGTQNNFNTPPTWSSPLIPASPNSSRRMQKENDSKMPATPRTEQYIQHLETQIATLTESMSSNANNNVIRKIKQLTKERSVLQQELAEWEKSFETRMQEELSNVRQREAQLTAQVRALQIDNRLKDHKITEQAREIKQTRQNLKDSQSTNHELERRIDDLTGLLAQSPVMLNSRARPQTMHSRTLSRLSESAMPSPRLPVRPSSMADVSLKDKDITPLRRHSTSLQAPAPILASPADSGNEKTAEQISVDIDDSTMLHTSSFGQTSIISSEPSALHDSSRLSSVSSATSASDLDTSAESSSKRHSIPGLNNKRKMRRFPSGARKLKPLVLQNSSEQESEKATGRARCNSFPYAPSFHAHPTVAMFGFPHLSTDLQTIADDEICHDSDLNGSPRGNHGILRSRELARAHTLNALEGGPHQYHLFDETTDGFKLGPFNEYHDEIELSSTDCVVPGASSPPLSRHNSHRNSPPPSEIGVEMETASADGDTTTLWEQHKSLQNELSEMDISGLDGIVISESSKQSCRSSSYSYSQSPKDGSRSTSYRYKFRRPTVDKIMESQGSGSGANMCISPVLYRGSPFDASSKMITPSSRKSKEVQDCPPHALATETENSFSWNLFSTARQIVLNARARLDQLQSLWLGSFSWIVLGIFLHKRDIQVASTDGTLDYAGLYDAPAAHKNQMSLIDGFRHTMTRRLRARVTTFASPIIERSRRPGLLFSLRCWSHFVTVILFALGLAVRYGPSDLMQIEPAPAKLGRCPHCGANSHDNVQGDSGSPHTFRAHGSSSRTHSIAYGA